MSDLTKNKAANALVWAAFFAFWFHSLHCLRACAASDRCVFGLTLAYSKRESTNVVCDVCHRPDHFPACGRSPLRSASRFERLEPSKAPSLGRERDLPQTACSDACPPSRVVPEKKIFGDFVALSNRTPAAIFANDVRLVPASAFLTRFAAAFSSPLYLRLRKLLN